MVKLKLLCSILLLALPVLTFSQVVEPREIGPNDFVLLEKEPAPINMDELKGMIGYPPIAKESEIQGKVIIRVQIDEKGNYVKHIVIKDPHPILTKAVESKIPNLRFFPGIQNGKPIKVWVTIPFDFKLLTSEPSPSPAAAPTKTAFYSLKEALADPANVKELYLHGQNFQTFPMDVLLFPNLVRLEIGDNQIKSIPPQIAQLRSLVMLGVSHNQLTSLPVELWGMPRLRVIKLNGNHFSKAVQKSLVKEHEGLLLPKDAKGKVQW
jgi:TonB family protein